MIGFKQPLGNSKIGFKKPLGSMFGHKTPLSHIQKMDVQTQQLAENKKAGSLERAKRNLGSKLGQWA